MSPPRKRYSASETGKHVQVTPYPPKEPSVGPKLMAYAISAHRSVSLGAVDRVYSVEESPQTDEGGQRSTRVGEKVLTSDVEGDSPTREEAEDGSTELRLQRPGADERRSNRPGSSDIELRLDGS
ncbi:hypothetical protein Bca52824_023681 [Brassica carinata]|uniref:Uncharacterized protein n=1 Tax=Brassica carinata TaxID=52824 RepID=A0A8X7VIY2_BRACI|nr:hypothetical protein Bca52824_023681 [Brassica carinata]